MKLNLIPFYNTITEESQVAACDSDSRARLATSLRVNKVIIPVLICDRDGYFISRLVTMINTNVENAIINSSVFSIGITCFTPFLRGI